MAIPPEGPDGFSGLPDPEQSDTGTELFDFESGEVSGLDLGDGLQQVFLGGRSEIKENIDTTTPNLHMGSEDVRDPHTLERLAEEVRLADAGVALKSYTVSVDGEAADGASTAAGGPLGFAVAFEIDDQSEGAELRIDGLPDGVTTNVGTVNADGSVTVRGDDIESLVVITEAASGLGEGQGFVLEIVAVGVTPLPLSEPLGPQFDAVFQTLGDAGAESEAQSQPGAGYPITTNSDDDDDDLVEDDAVNAPLDTSAADPVLSVSNAGGDEDTAIALDIQAQLSDLDGSEQLTVTIANIPIGSVLSAGTDNGDGTWTLDGPDLPGLTITPPTDFSGAINLDITATSTEEAGGDTASVFANLDVSVDAVLDAPGIDLSYGSTTTEGVSGSVPTDGMVFRLSANDMDGNGNTGADGSNVSNWADLSGNGHNATPTGSSPSVDASSLNSNGGVAFDSGNDGLTIGNDAAINTGTYDEKSFSFAIETGASVDGFQVIYEQGGGSRGYSLSIAPDPDTGDPKLFAFAWNNVEWPSGEQYKVIDLGEVEPNTSYSAAMVHDATDGSGTFKGYMNGELQGSLENVGTMNPHAGAVGVGKVLNASVRPDTLASSGDGHEFQGSIAELASWNSALSEDDVAELTAHYTAEWETPGGEQSHTVEINLAITSDAGDGASVQSITIDALPDGVTLSAGTVNPDATITLREADLDGLTITVPGDQTTFPIQVTATLVDAAGNTATTTTSMSSPDLYLAGTTLETDASSGGEDSAIALDIDVELNDTDGSETVAITIDGVPSGAVLSAGTDNGDGTWTLGSGDLDGLTVTPPSDSDSNFQLGVKVTTTETSTGDTAETTSSIDVTVQAEADPVTVSAAIGDVVEASEGSVPTDGMVFRFNAKDVNGNGDGSDNPSDNGTVSAWNDVSGNGNHATTHGSAPSFDTDGMSGNGGIAFDSGNDALEIPSNADTNTGSYSEKSFAFAFETGASVDGFQVIYEQGGTSNGYSLSIAPNDDGDPTLYAFAWGESYWPSGEQHKAIELGVVEPNTSYSAAMVHDATNGSGTFTGFLNGDQVGELTNVGTMGSHGGAISIGSMNDNTVRPDTFGDTSDTNGSQFQGTISEVASWNTALSAEDVSELTQHMAVQWDTPGGIATDGVTVELDITAGLSDTDGSETLSITVGDMPDGAILSAGTDNGDGSWTLEPGDLNGLTLNVPNGAGGFDLSVTATAREANGDTSSTEISLSVDDLTADGGTLEADNASGDEDTAIALDIDLDLTDTDGSETLSLTISGVPDGASLSAGTDGGDGTWTLDTEDLDGLSITPAANAGDDFQLTVTATTTESSTGNTATTTATLDVSVDGQVDDFDLSVSVGDATPTEVSLPSDDMVFHLNAKNIDGDGNATNQPGDGGALNRWEDLSGNNHDATPSGSAPTFDTDAFDGNGGVQVSSGNDGMTIADSADINTANFSEKSFSFAFETGSSVDGFQVIYEQGGSGRGYSLSIAPDPDTGDPKLFAFAWNNAEWPSGNQYKAIDLGPVEPNTSYSAAMVHDANDGTGTFKGYLNGELEGTLNNVQEMRAHAGDIGIGKVVDGSIRPDTFASSGDGHEFQGNIGEIASWNRALSDSDIEDITNSATQEFGTPGGTPEGFSFDVDLTTSLGDTDGSETVSYVISGLPTDGVLTAGTDNGDGTWSLSAEDADGLSMAVPSDAADFMLSIRADVTEADGDTRSAIENVEVDVTDNGFDGGTQGTADDDVLSGGTTDDLIFGNDGNDQISGGAGNDRLFGGIGDDTISGGEGNDHLDGGAGNDIFTFGAGAGNDSIQGGDGWLDKVQLVGVEDGPGDAWSLDLDKGSIEEQADGYVALSSDASGTITLEDGSSVAIEGIERIEW